MEILEIDTSLSQAALDEQKAAEEAFNRKHKEECRMAAERDKARKAKQAAEYFLDQKNYLHAVAEAEDKGVTIEFFLGVMRRRRDGWGQSNSSSSK